MSLNTNKKMAAPNFGAIMLWQAFILNLAAADFWREGNMRGFDFWLAGALAAAIASAFSYLAQNNDAIEVDGGFNRKIKRLAMGALVLSYLFFILGLLA